MKTLKKSLPFVCRLIGRNIIQEMTGNLTFENGYMRTKSKGVVMAWM